MTLQNITAQSGRRCSWQTTVLRNGQTVSLVGAAVFMMVKRKASDLDAAALVSLAIGSGIVLDNAPDGEISIVIPETPWVAPGVYTYDLKVVHPTFGPFSSVYGDITFTELPTDRIS